MKNNKYVCVAIDENLYKTLEAEATAQDRKIAQVIRLIIKDYYKTKATK